MQYFPEMWDIDHYLLFLHHLLSVEELLLALSDKIYVLFPCNLDGQSQQQNSVISRPTDSPDALASYSLLEAIIEPDEVAAIILYP